MSLHGLRAGFFAEAYRQGARNQKSWTTFVVANLQTMQGYVRRAKRLSESQVRKLGL